MPFNYLTAADKQIYVQYSNMHFNIVVKCSQAKIHTNSHGFTRHAHGPHDFEDKELGHAIPFGMCYISENQALTEICQHFFHR